MDESNLQERLWGAESQRYIVKVSSYIPSKDRAEMEGF